MLVDDEFEVEVAALDGLLDGGLAGLVLFGSAAHSVGVGAVYPDTGHDLVNLCSTADGWVVFPG